MGNHPVSAAQHLLGDRGVEPLVRVEEGHAELWEEQEDAQRQQDGHGGPRSVDRVAVTDDLRMLAERSTGAPPRVKRLKRVGTPRKISSGPSGDSEAKSECNTADRRSQPVALRRPPANFRDRAELFVATSWSSRRARFTEFAVRKHA